MYLYTVNTLILLSLHFFINFVDNQRMGIGKIIPIAMKVLTNPTVVITAVIIFVYMDLVCYIVRYKKRPAKPKQKAQVAPPPPEQETSGEQTSSE